MKRLHLIEIEDQPWCPRLIRDYATDYLQFAIVAWKAYASVMPLLADALKRTCSRQILDLCSGGAGPWVDMLPALRAAGVDTWDAQKILSLLESNLRRFEEHRDCLRADVRR